MQLFAKSASGSWAHDNGGERVLEERIKKLDLLEEFVEVGDIRGRTSNRCADSWLDVRMRYRLGGSIHTTWLRK